MRILALALAIACSFALPLMAAETPGTHNVEDTIDALLERLGKLKPAEQQAWLQRLEQRANYAARITMKGDELAQQEARVHAQLHQKMITWKSLRNVIVDTDRLERDAVAQLVRRYRDLVFDTFHGQIDTYNERQQAWVEVFSDWKSAGRQFDQQDRLIHWLEAAIRSATPGAISPTPEKPTFESVPPPEKPAPKPPAGPGASPEPGKVMIPEQPKSEPPKAEPPKSEPPKAEPPKSEPAKPEQPKSGQPKSEQPKSEAGKPAAEPAKPSAPSGKSSEKPDAKASK